MADDGLEGLMEDATESESLRLRFSQDRSVEELVESARDQGYAISDRDARKILAGAYLTSDRLDSEVRNKIVGGLSWDFLEKVEKVLDGQYDLLEKTDAWERALDFHSYVFQRSDDDN